MWKNANAVIDTAAQVTVISCDFARSLKNKLVVKEQVKLRGANKNQTITA